MAISQKFDSVDTVKAQIKQAIIDKGVEVTSNDAFDTYPNKIAQITSGSTPVISSLTVIPSTTAQTITAPSGTDGYSPIQVNAVTSAIDNNITANNIKKNVTILGVTGTLETGITPTGTLSIAENGTYNVTNYASANVNVSKYGATIDDILGEKNSNNVLQHPATNCNLVFTGIGAVAAYVLAYKFLRNPAIQTVSFPDLIQLTYTRSLYYAFSYASNLTSVSFPKLKTISGSACLAYAFTNTALTTLSFPALTSVGTANTNQFNSMLSGVTGCTVHFPRAMQSTIGSWTSVTDGFGGTNTTVLFDL